MKSTRTRRTAAVMAAFGIAMGGVLVGAPGTNAQPRGGLDDEGAEQADRVVEESSTGSYVVVLRSEPLLAEFGQDGLDSPEAEAKGEAMVQEQDELLDDVGLDEDAKLTSYQNAMNGFAVVMTIEQAEVMASKPDVAMVLPNELQQPTTDASPEFLGLSGESGVWATEATGDGVLVGIIDSGIWPEHPSLDPAGFTGTAAHGPLGTYVDDDPTDDVPAVEYPGCEFGNTTHTLAAGLSDAPFECNAKLIGARQVMPTYEELTGLSDIEYDSARDEDGHGTHTATTAAGNADVPATVLGIDRGLVSGVAPDAQVAVYKALGELGGYGSDLALAIDVAVADGVDVINYSIGSSSFAIGPDDVAFFFATLAGVDVATSNGNSGPGAATTGSPASVPWLTSVGASTHDRTFEGQIDMVGLTRRTKSRWGWPWPWWSIERLSVDGVSITGGTGLRLLVDAADYGNELCESGVKWKGNIRGKIVLCKRGANARIDKSYAVSLGGGAGMVLYNTFDADTLITDTHWVPSLHVNFTDGTAIKEYIDRTKKPVARIRGGESAETKGSVMAAFSSRGENLLSADLIKPDLTAPGVNILAGNTPTPTSGPPGNLFQSISGTSMSSPHVAGLMALLSESHPDWSPAMVKSALMTTARQDVTKEDAVTPADPFDMGAGHVDPPSMFDPGLVYDVGNELGVNEYVGVACGVGLVLVSYCGALADLGYTDPSNYNQASIASASLPGRQTLVRTVTNVSGVDLAMTPVLGGLDGIDATVEPSTVVVPAGGTASYSITFGVTTAPLDEWTFGSLTLEGGGYSVYSPIALRPVTLGVPGEVEAAISDGGTSFEVEFGYSGDYLAQGHGLYAADVISGSVDQDPDATFSPSDVGAGATAHTLTVAADTAFVRIFIPPVEEEDTTDLDLYVYDPSGNLYALSGNGGTNETVDVLLPEPGEWTFYVHGWAVPTDTVDYDAYTWQIPLAPGGDMGVSAPTSATIGTTGTVDVTWDPTLESGYYLGAVSHTANGSLDGLTLISVSG